MSTGLPECPSILNLHVAMSTAIKSKWDGNCIFHLHFDLKSLTNPNLNENEVATKPLKKALGFVITNMVNKPFRGIFLLND